MKKLKDLKDGDVITPQDLKQFGGLAGLQRSRSKRKIDFCNDGHPSESFEQKNVADYLDELQELYGIWWCHVPNGGARYRGAAGLLKAEGVKKGVLDILIFTPPPMGQFSGLAIELKRVKGGVTSLDQKRWLLGLTQCGWSTSVCHGADEAIELIKSYGYDQRVK